MSTQVEEREGAWCLEDESIIKSLEMPVKQTVFKPGWSYSLFLSRNGYAPSEVREGQWRSLNKEANHKQVTDMRTLALAGAKTKIGQRAVFNSKDGRFDTSLTARVVQAGCSDADLIADCLLRARLSASKRLDAMSAVAASHGVL
jgi:hypothetical protein